MLTFSSFAEFAAFLMLYVARADGQLHHLEEEILKERLRYFSRETETLLEKFYAMTAELEDPKLTCVLRENLDSLKPVSAQDREYLIKSLYAIVNADGRVRAEETQVMKRLREILFILAV